MKGSPAMASREMYFGANFNTVPCPVCGAMFSRCGLPNHIRRHQHLVLQRSGKDRVNRRSPAWWDGWKEGYKLGMRDGANSVRKVISEGKRRDQVEMHASGRHRAG